MNDLTPFEQAIIAAREGRKEEARNILAQVLRTNPSSEQAWLWMSAVVETNQERIQCLQKALTINPNNTAARDGLTKLQISMPCPSISKLDAPHITKCPNCGSAGRSGSRFCSSCGQPMRAIESQPRKSTSAQRPTSRKNHSRSDGKSPKPKQTKRALVAGAIISVLIILLACVGGATMIYQYTVKPAEGYRSEIPPSSQSSTEVPDGPQDTPLPPSETSPSSQSGTEVPDEQQGNPLRVVLVEVRLVETDEVWKYYEAHFAIENHSDQVQSMPEEWYFPRGTAYAGEEYTYEASGPFNRSYSTGSTSESDMLIPPNVRIRGGYCPPQCTGRVYFVEFKVAAALTPTRLHLDGIGDFDLLNPSTNLTYPFIEAGKTELLEFPIGVVKGDTLQIIEEVSTSDGVLQFRLTTTNLNKGYEIRITTPYREAMFISDSGVPHLRCFDGSCFPPYRPLNPGETVSSMMTSTDYMGGTKFVFFVEVDRDGEKSFEAYRLSGDNWE